MEQIGDPIDALDVEVNSLINELSNSPPREQISVDVKPQHKCFADLSSPETSDNESEGAESTSDEADSYEVILADHPTYPWFLEFQPFNDRNNQGIVGKPCFIAKCFLLFQNSLADTFKMFVSGVLNCFIRCCNFWGVYVVEIIKNGEDGN